MRLFEARHPPAEIHSSQLELLQSCDFEFDDTLDENFLRSKTPADGCASVVNVRPVILESKIRNICVANLTNATINRGQPNLYVPKPGCSTSSAGLLCKLHQLTDEAQKKLARCMAGEVKGRLISAAWAGAVSKTATAPLETIRMQMMTGTKGGFFTVARHTWLQGGVFAFFSGNEADVLRTMPSKAIELASYDLYKKLLSPAAAVGAAPSVKESADADVDGKVTKQTNKRANAKASIVTTIAGGLAGITSTVVLFPLETTRTRLAVNSTMYRNMMDCMSQIVRTEGFFALYRGLDASLLGVIPYAAVRLGMYDGLKFVHQKISGQSTIPAQNSMLYGALAAVTSATISFPLEVVRRRKMLGMVQGNTFPAMAHIARTEGIGALYKGVLLTWIKQAPQYAVTFCCYDMAKAWLAKHGNPNPNTALVVAASPSKAITLPRPQINVSNRDDKTPAEIELEENNSFVVEALTEED